MLATSADPRHGLQFVAQEPVLDAAELCEIVMAGPIDQRIFIDPADPGSIRAKRCLCALGQAALHLAQIFEYPAARPIEIGRVIEQDIDEAVSDERIAAHHARARHRQHRRRERVRNLVLDDLRGLARIGGADDDLDVGQVGQRIDCCRAQSAHSDDDQREGCEQDEEARPDGRLDDPRDHFVSPVIGRAATPVRLASLSSRNWPDATTFSPGASPARISVLPPASRPALTSAGR